MSLAADLDGEGVEMAEHDMVRLWKLCWVIAWMLSIERDIQQLRRKHWGLGIPQLRHLLAI